MPKLIRTYIWILLLPAFTVAAHVLVLQLDGHSLWRSPTADLSQSPLGWLQTMGLLGFAVAHGMLGTLVVSVRLGRLWPAAGRLLQLAGLVLGALALSFLSGLQSWQLFGIAVDPLWLLASLIGCVMGLVLPGMLRQRCASGTRVLPGPRGAVDKAAVAGKACGLFLALWLVLTALAAAVDSSWLGLYERVTGAVYLGWFWTLALALNSVSVSADPR